MGKEPIGKNALCRKECDLTFEHIPPRTAFNSTPVKSVTGDKIIEDSERKNKSIHKKGNTREFG